MKSLLLILVFFKLLLTKQKQDPCSYNLKWEFRKIFLQIKPLIILPEMHNLKARLLYLIQLKKHLQKLELEEPMKEVKKLEVKAVKKLDLVKVEKKLDLVKVVMKKVVNKVMLQSLKVKSKLLKHDL